MEVRGEQGDQLAELMGRAWKTVKQKQGGQGAVAGFSIEHPDAVSVCEGVVDHRR
jgi:hypothetical protein